MRRRDLLLHLLREAGPAGLTTGQILAAGVGSRYGGRIHELRNAGCQIKATRIRDGAWRYVLEAEARRPLEETPPSAVSLGGMSPSSASPPAAPPLFDVPAPAPVSAVREDWEAAA